MVGLFVLACGGDVCEINPELCEPPDTAADSFACFYANPFAGEILQCDQYPDGTTMEEAQALCDNANLGGIAADGTLQDGTCQDVLDMSIVAGECQTQIDGVDVVILAQKAEDLTMAEDCDGGKNFTSAWGCATGGGTFVCY